MTANSIARSPGAAQDFSAIPSELKALPQWLCWKYEHRGSLKPTKVPLNPKNGMAASVTDYSTWGTFAEAKAAYDACHCSGIGFVFTENDPYCFIDLDDAKGNAEAQARQSNIIEQFNSYTETSPSGLGVHIIIKAKLPHGRRREDVEIYPHERFATFTGMAIHNVGIAERQELAETLFAQMGGAKADAAGIQPDREAPADDAAIVGELCSDPARAANYNGDLTSVAGDCSRADLNLCNALARISGNRAQVERIWLASPLGQRHKTQSRRDYRQRTIEAAFNELPLAPVNHGFTVNGHQFFTPADAPAKEPEIIDAGSWHGQLPPNRSHMVAGWIAAGQVTFLTGKGAAGKSLLCQQLATATALGVPFLGQHAVRGFALYVTCEDDAGELHRRQVALCTALRASLKDLSGCLGIVSLAGMIGNEMAVFDRAGTMQLAPAFHWLKRTIKAKGARLVVLDNVAHLFAGDENNRHHVAAFVNLLNGLAADTGAAIILIGHPNKSGNGYSGSTAWENQVRTRLFMAVPENPDGTIPDLDARTLTRAKANYGRAGDFLKFRWHQGAFVTEDELPGDLNAAIAANSKANQENQTFLKCLAAMTAQLRATSHMKGTNYAPALFARMPEANGMSRLAFERAMERLFHTGQIQAGQFLWNDGYRKPKHGLKAAEICGDPPAATPCGDLRRPPSQVFDFPCGDPRAATPLYTTYIDDGASHAPRHPNDNVGGAP